MITRVEISEAAEKDLRSVPMHIVEKLNRWIESVECSGVETIRRIPGLHDEPLQGKRFGQRSLRLNRAYRAIYRVCRNSQEKFLLVEEVNKHDY